MKRALLALLFTSAPLVAQEAPRITGIAHVAVRVADLQRSRAFYESLGYAQPFVIEKDGAVVESFIKISDHQYLELYPADAQHPVGFQHVCWEAVNLAGLYPVYTALGVVAPPVRKAGAGNLLLAWKGPEAQTEEITEYQPGSRHSEDIGQHLGPARVSQQLIAAVVPMHDPKAAADYFTSHMKFDPLGVHEGAEIVSPPDVRGASFGFLPASSTVPLALVFHVDSVEKAGTQLRLLHPVVQGKRVVVTDPDGNSILFTSETR